ncbi:MAG: aminotransferase class V-fold PLP-dependent enzyme, partial [Actinobacteria bacterium]|nr:aminotransferase class V-fold PLP-dependent enzyme [Actinomycetota bacterium]
PGGGLYTAAVADFIALGVNRYVGLWQAAPLFVAMEQSVIDWLISLFGYPSDARGILTSGGSMANFAAVVTARRAKLPEDFLGGVLYVTEQTHASVAKAASLAGFPRRAVRSVPVRDYRMNVDELRVMIRDDRAAGHRPFMVVASAGTTNTGSVDPIAEVSELCELEGLWLHVDGAYGGAFQLTDRGRAAFTGIDGADSITLDPHKGMFLPYGTGALIVREGDALRFAHQSTADYLQDLAPDGELPNYSEYSAELSREFRGLRVWLPLQLHGVGAFREALDEKLDLARVVFDALTETPDFLLPAGEPDLSIVPFRFQPSSVSDPGEIDDLNARLLERINASKRVFLSSTQLDGRFTLRVAVLSHRTHRDRIDEAVSVIRECAASLIAEG